MVSKNILLTFLISFILIVFSSCKEDKRILEKIDFTTDYKFLSDIENEVSNSKEYQRSGTYFALKGDYKNALIQWDLMGGKEEVFSKEQIDSIKLKYKIVNASDYIIDKAKENQIIIINEAHHNSFHRFFTKTLLKGLYEKGYTNLGLEALANNDSLNSALNNRKYPIQKTGYYTKDPQFGNLIRDALEIGYKLFAYETLGSESGKPREIDQAKNIEKVIDSRPNEKFLIHCGYDHALEGAHNYWEKAMASRLTEYTGINPLTINQASYSERSRPELNHPFLKALNFNESSILIDNKNNPLRYEREDAWADIAVFHPNTEYINNRPNWLFENGNKNVPVKLNDIEIDFPVMVLACKKGENLTTAVPIDIKEVESKTENCNLGLRKGVYEVVVTNGKESVKFEQQVK
ncbi:hypothetical protein [uncultured Marixanthomonas sp.]|uniref:hypothetical protein n=1 Tax=uncultured Marixanthomonas sp. TaxID=757245 RepID=UPI0030DAC77C|tara:strand:- start:5738 stop:6955 length:1218 start_codon:yes stop_codon:yes gene_type:complete